MPDEELISKHDLLRQMQISYGTLYRWKRMNLIPESWFIRKSTHTGQATYMPKDKVISRIERIKELKGDLSPEQMAEIFSPNVKSFKIPFDDFVDLNIVSRLTVTAFVAVFKNRKELSFDDVFTMYVVDHLLKISGIYIEDAKQIIRMLEKYLTINRSKEFQLVLMRKMGIPFTLLVPGEEEILLEDGTEVIACANLSEFEEALKDRLIA